MGIAPQRFWVSIFYVWSFNDNLCSGQISASLAAMQRTMDDYDSMAKREMIQVKQEKARLYVDSHKLHKMPLILWYF